jgi:hypothetical protein
MFDALMEMVNKCNHKDVDFIRRCAGIFQLCFIDWDTTEGEFRDYIDPMATINLDAWLEENCISKERSRLGQPIYYFDDFYVLLTYESEYALR